MDLVFLLKSKLPILITGETGTGKTRLAKNIGEHANNFIHINMASLNEKLFESEIFGHKKGSFTGAISDKVGFCEAVGDGILFFDEIGEISPIVQAKLLTLIDEKIFYRVGCTKARAFRGNIIFATNKNLEEMVFSGKFREDLYYRIRYLEKRLIPMREQQDIFTLIIEAVNSAKVKYNRSILFDEKVLNTLVSYQWPGNFRELLNTIDYLFLLEREKIRIDDLPYWLQKNQRDSFSNENEDYSYNTYLEKFEYKYFVNLLIQNYGRINQSSQIAGISKATLISKLKKYGIKREHYKNKEISAVG